MNNPTTAWLRAKARDEFSRGCLAVPMSKLHGWLTEAAAANPATPSLEQLKAENAAMRDTIADAISRVESIVCTKEPDRGVILVSSASPTDFDPLTQAHTYRYENFSPLGDALIALHQRLTFAPPAELPDCGKETGGEKAGRCTCDCATPCVLGRTGMELRCTADELRAECSRLGMAYKAACEENEKLEAKYEALLEKYRTFEALDWYSENVWEMSASDPTYIVTDADRAKLQEMAIGRFQLSPLQKAGFLYQIDKPAKTAEAELARVREAWGKLKAEISQQLEANNNDPWKKGRYNPGYEIVLDVMNGLLPPAPQAEERPERPPMLLAKRSHAKHLPPVWWARVKGGWRLVDDVGGDYRVIARGLADIDRDASDPAALELYDADISSPAPAEGGERCP